MRNTNEDYIKTENYEQFVEYFVETTILDIPTFKFPEEKEKASKYRDLEHIINNFKLVNLGSYYHENVRALTKLKLIVFKYRELFAQHKWDVGSIRRDPYVHKAVFYDQRYHNTRCRPFRLSPKEKQVIAKYPKNLCGNEIISPTGEGKAGVHLFLVGKHSLGANGENEGNEGWKSLKKEYEEKCGIKIKENNRKKWKANENYLINNEGYEAFKEKEDGWDYDNPNETSPMDTTKSDPEPKNKGLQKVLNEFEKREEAIGYLDKESKKKGTEAG